MRSGAPSRRSLTRTRDEHTFCLVIPCCAYAGRPPPASSKNREWRCRIAVGDVTTDVSGTFLGPRQVRVMGNRAVLAASVRRKLEGCPHKLFAEDFSGQSSLG